MKIIIGIVLYFSSFLLVFGENVENEKKSNNIFDVLLSADLFINMFFAILALVVTILLSKKIKGVIEKYLVNIGDEDTSRAELLGVISRTINIGIWLIGITVALGAMGLPISLFMGGIGFGLGLTLKPFLTNFVAGILIVIQGNYKTGDLIEISQKMGKITKINTLFTEVEQLNGVKFFIPNIQFIEQEVENLYANDRKRMEIDIDLVRDTDLLKVKKIVNNVLDSFPNVLKAPEHQLWVTNFGDSSIRIKVLFWLNPRDKFYLIQSNVFETINLAFRQSGIKVAYPHLIINNLNEIKGN